MYINIIGLWCVILVVIFFMKYIICNEFSKVIISYNNVLLFIINIIIVLSMCLEFCRDCFIIFVGYNE